MATDRQISKIAWAAALPFAVFLAHGALFAAWEIDDAGISYAYARNLADGQGLVSQPGAAPVEGFTNLLWVVLLAALLPLVESPGLAARCLSYGLVLAAFATLALGARAWFPQRWLPIALVGLSTTALVTGFPAWTLSGLENGLHAFLLALFLVATTEAPDSRRGGAGVGLIWTLLLATRPDAAPLVVMPCIVWAWKAHRRAPAAFALAAVAGFAGLTTFRVLYFADVLPNTYYAKNATGAELLATISWTPLNGLLFVLCGAAALAAGIPLVGWLARRTPWPRGRPLSRAGLPALVTTLILCYLVFETLPTDWMPEGRFATPLFLLAPTTLLCLMRRSPLRLRLAGAVLLLLAAGYSWRHTPAFVESPPAPFDSVVTLSLRLDSVGQAMGTGRATKVLLPDIGGALWEDRFAVLDLAGMTDRRIARTLGGRHREAFYDYVFEDQRPELIWIHTYWKRTAELEADARLARDYEILTADPEHTLYVRSAPAAEAGRERLAAAFEAPR